MFKNLFGKKIEQVQLPEVRWDNAFIVFIAVLVNVRGNEVGLAQGNIQPSQFINIVVQTLADNKFSITEHKIQDIIAGYLDYTLQPDRYNSLLDLMLNDRAMKDNSSYTLHCMQIAQIFSSFMFSAQDLLVRSSNK